MQQHPQDRRFAEDQQQPIYRFPQNQQRMQGWQPQQTFSVYGRSEEPLPVQNNPHVRNKPKHQRKRHIFTLWNLFAVIGILSVIFLGVKHIMIPILVKLYALTGGAL